MPKLLFLAAVTLFVMSLGALPSSAESVRSVGDLIEAGTAADGQEVVLELEMIGDIMTRKDYAWVNGLDASGALGLWMPEALASEVQVLGNSRYTGDRFRVTGVFHKTCSEHGGDLDVHVVALERLQAGTERKMEIPGSKVWAAAGLTLAGALLGGGLLRLRRT